MPKIKVYSYDDLDALYLVHPDGYIEFSFWNTLEPERFIKSDLTLTELSSWPGYDFIGEL